MISIASFFITIETQFHATPVPVHSRRVRLTMCIVGCSLLSPPAELPRLLARTALIRISIGGRLGG